jgi:hypothetical protein
MSRPDDWDDLVDDDDAYDEFDDEDDETDDGPILLGRVPQDEEMDLGPDERDRDLLDGSWEQNYYSGQHRQRNWNAIMLGLAILVVLGLLISTAGVFFR